MRVITIRRLGWLLLLSALAVSALRGASPKPSLADRVIILANASERESIELAQYYAKARAIPLANVIALPMPKVETLNWPEFIQKVYQPLQDELVKRGWIDAVSSDLVDEIGRRRYVVSSHHISYLVVCRGVPLRVQHDGHLYKPAPPITDHKEFQTNQGAVDSELSLLAVPQYPISGFVMNPLFGVGHPNTFQESWVVKVSRLDGPSFESARALVDHAIEAERFGLIGRAYVDIGGIHKLGDQWFDLAAKEIERANFDLSVDRLPTTFPRTARFDAPALYFGWYAWDVNGPFIEPGFRFPPGAVALHLHSFSATTLNETHHGWTGPLVALGVTATVGNVFEPYLEFTHSPPILARALLRGDNWGDAVYTSVRALSWETMAIGDPLYRPFAISFSEQWAKRDQLPDELYPYVVLRELQRLQHQGASEEARRIADEVMSKRPSAPVALAQAQLLAAAGDHTGACRAAVWVTRLKKFAPTELPWALEAAQDLVENSQTDVATDFIAGFINDPELPTEFRDEFLNHGVLAARASNRDDLAAKWQASLDAAKAAAAGK